MTELIQWAQTVPIWQWAIAYFCGSVLLGFIVGWGQEEEMDPSLGLLLFFLWPVFLLIVGLNVLVAGPYDLARYLSKKRIQPKKGFKQ